MDALPLGVLYVCGYPPLGMPPTTAPDGWGWYDHVWDLLGGLLHVLVRTGRAKATVRLFRGMAVVRVYLVASSAAATPHLRRVLSLMDYSLHGWHGRVAQAWAATPEVAVVVAPHLPAPPRDTTTHHLRRMELRLPYSRPPPADRHRELVDVYNSLRFRPGHRPAPPIAALRSTLFPYQQESVQAMLLREEEPLAAPMPHFAPVNTSPPWWLDTHTLTAHTEPAPFQLPRGGILAENMGLGKTCICLALVCCTKDEPAEIPRHPQVTVPRAPPTLRRLSTLCAETVGLHAIPWARFRSMLPASCTALLEQHPGRFTVVPLELARTLRRTPPPPRHLVCTATTLVVCPDLLVHQWQLEVALHLHAGALRVLTVARALPSVSRLASHDLVLVPASVFAAQDAVPDLPLYAAMWKRLIVDEGHSMALALTRAARVVADLWYERAWCVSGTPTAGLTNLTVALDDEDYTVRRRFDAASDLARLGQLVSGLLRVAPWANNRRLWRQTVGTNLFQLQHLLQELMVRHAPEDTVALPPLHHRAVLLAPLPHDALAVDLFAAVLAVNAVLLEREGADYMFSPQNRPQLRRLVGNLQRATFYWTGFAVADVQALVSVLRRYLDKGTALAADARLLARAVAAAERALDSPTWRTAAAIHEMGYYVGGADEAAVQTFSTGRVGADAVFGFPQLSAWQGFHYKHRFDREPPLEPLAAAGREFWDAYWTSGSSRDNQRKKPANSSDVKEVLAMDHGSGGGIHRERSATPAPAPHLHVFSPPRPPYPHILGTASAKLLYLGARLLEHQQRGDKSLVFFEFEDLAYYLTELLDLLGVDYLLYAPFVKLHQRNGNLERFRHTAGAMALVMDLRLAAHGLTIIDATHVYFVSPVWRKSVEAQAIKRAHRIGQQHEVYVETLVLAGTMEEAMYARRALEEETTRPVADDEAVQRFILEHRFLGHADRAEYEPFPASAPAAATAAPDVGALPEPHVAADRRGVHGWVVPVFSALNLAKRNRDLAWKGGADETARPVEAGRLDGQHTSPRKRVRFG